MATPKDPMAALLAQVAAYRSKTPEQLAADKLRQGVAQRITAAGGVATQARITAVIDKTAATKAAAAKAAAAAAPVKTVPTNKPFVRTTGEYKEEFGPNRPGYPQPMTPAQKAEWEAQVRAAGSPVGLGTPGGGVTDTDKTPAGWSQGNKTGWAGGTTPPGWQKTKGGASTTGSGLGGVKGNVKGRKRPAGTPPGPRAATTTTSSSTAPKSTSNLRANSAEARRSNVLRRKRDLRG